MSGCARSVFWPNFVFLALKKTSKFRVFFSRLSRGFSEIFWKNAHKSRKSWKTGPPREAKIGRFRGVFGRSIFAKTRNLDFFGPKTGTNYAGKKKPRVLVPEILRLKDMGVFRPKTPPPEPPKIVCKFSKKSANFGKSDGFK